MTDKVQKIREEVERLREKIMGIRTDFADGQKSVLTELLAFIDALQKEPISIWHTAKEPPEMYRKYFARYSDGRINGSWERHDDGFILWKDVIKEHNITHWCYVEDLIKL